MAVRALDGAAFPTHIDAHLRFAVRTEEFHHDVENLGSENAEYFQRCARPFRVARDRDDVMARGALLQAAGGVSLGGHRGAAYRTIEVKIGHPGT